MFLRLLVLFLKIFVFLFRTSCVWVLFLFCNLEFVGMYILSLEWFEMLGGSILNDILPLSSGSV